MKNILIFLLTIAIFTGCSNKAKEKENQYKFELKTIDSKILILTKDNDFKFTLHPTQTYLEKVSFSDIETVGYLINGIEYSTKNILTGNQYDSLAHVLIIYTKDGKSYQFFLQNKDEVSNVLKNSHFKISELGKMHL